MRDAGPEYNSTGYEDTGTKTRSRITGTKAQLRAVAVIYNVSTLSVQDIFYKYTFK